MGSEEDGKTVSESQTAGLREIFRRFDGDSDGSLTVPELCALLRSLGLRPSGKQLGSLLANVDANGNGLIEFVELVNVIAADVANSVEICNKQENLLELFRALDRDGNGYVTAVELAHSMAKLGHALSLRELTELITKADNDIDGKISFAEFVAAITSEFSDLLLLLRALDKDSNGYITAVEVVQFMAKRDRALSLREMTELITKSDTDSDGKISFSEFAATVTSESANVVDFSEDDNGYITVVDLAHSMAVLLAPHSP